MNSALRNSLLKASLYTLLFLFLVPGIALWFTNHAQKSMDADYRTAIVQHLNQASDISETERQQRLSYINTHPVSALCASSDDENRSARESLCETYSHPWQFYWAQTIATICLILGAICIFTLASLGLLAFVNEKAQYLSLVLGWRSLTLFAAVQALAQAGLLVWLSFWLTAFFWHKYYVKLILVVAIAVLFTAFYVVAKIFKSAKSTHYIEGEQVGELHAPELWLRVRNLAARLKTPPPDHIVAGIDANFFVTEAPLHVAGHKLEGRTLYISIPLLRVLSQTEADAVLTHELAHLRGGDTAHSAAVGPKLQQFDQYCAEMAQASIWPVFHLMNLYRLIYEFAHAEHSRHREFLADKIAAKVISGQAVANSLLKVAAYASYRNDIENELFARNQQHGEQIGIAQYVAEGLHPYAMSPDFITAMDHANVPHPYDSHPRLADRMKNVGVYIPDIEFGPIVTKEPENSWANYIKNAKTIEEKLWAGYEQNFAQEHHHSLAYRYEPATQSELELVLQYFPDHPFPLRNGYAIVVTYAGWILPGTTEAISWDVIEKYELAEGMFADVLKIKHSKGHDPKQQKVKLPGLKKVRDEFVQVSNHYWQRHQIMRHQQRVAA